MDSIEINGVENPLATLIQRLLAQIIDGIIYFAILALSSVPFGFNGVVVGALIAGLYFFFQDVLKGGQSSGKRVVNTAVIDIRTGEWCGFGQSFVRNVVLSLLSFIDWIFISGPKRQRLGGEYGGNPDRPQCVNACGSRRLTHASFAAATIRDRDKQGPGERDR